MSIRKVLVVGPGQMGGGIAQMAAAAGFEVVLNGVDQPSIDKCLAGIRRNLEKLAEKGKLEAGRPAEVMSRLSGQVSLAEAAAGADLVIEAVTEQLEVKREIFAELDNHVPAGAILASNTSSLSVTRIAGRTARPERVIGLHFFNPVPVMKLVEIIVGLATSESVYTQARAFVEALGKASVRVEDMPGFCANRIAVPMINEAAFALMEGAASAEDIDQCLKLGYNHPMGPLALGDLIGLDTILYIMEVLQEGYGDNKYRPCPLLRKYVDAGWLGRKSGRGFFNYTE